MVRAMTAARRKVRLFGAVVRPLQAFLRLEAASGILLLGCAVGALLFANVHPQSYRGTFVPERTTCHRPPAGEDAGCGSPHAVWLVLRHGNAGLLRDGET